jgi:hypothetical protein
MPRGGRRPGSGRKPGSQNKKKSYAIVKAAFASGEPVPLEVMLQIMRFHWREWEKDGDKTDLKEAGMWAQASAPYMHPRLQAIDQRSTVEAGDTLSALLRSIDGTTTGIGRGLTVSRPLLEAQQPLRDHIEGGAEDSVPAELGAAGVSEQDP